MGVLSAVLFAVAMQVAADVAPCVPVVYLARIDSTEVERSGDIHYIGLSIKDLDGTFVGQHMLAGDPDTSLVQWLTQRNHHVITITLCGGK